MISRKALKIAATGAVCFGTFATLHTISTEYDFDSIGIVRVTRAVRTVWSIGRYYKKNLYKNGLDKQSEEYHKLKSKAHNFGAERLLELCCINKGVYIKVGQHIGALDYLLPKEYVSKLKVLHNSAPQSSFTEVLDVIKEDFHKDPYEVFSSIEKEPLGSASLAQVHKATLKDGTPVALKVQHKSVKKNAYIDIKTMSALVKITSWIFPEFKFDWLVDETKKNIPKELDFKKEGENAEKVQSLFKNYDWLKIPKIYWNYSTNRILTMEFIDGGKVIDLNYLKANKINPLEVSKKIGALYSHMIFVSGFVHSDPHPGNILIRKNNNKEEIVLLDHGLYAELSNEFRWEYSKLWLAILNKDKISMKKHCSNLGVTDLYGLLSCMVSGRSWDTLMSGIEKKKYTSGEKELFQKEIPNLLPKITEVLERVNRNMLLILKTNDLIRSIEYNLNTHSRVSAFSEMSRCCIKSIYGEQLKHCKSNFERWKLNLLEKFALFKIMAYYTYLRIKNFNKEIMY